MIWGARRISQSFWIRQMCAPTVVYNHNNKRRLWWKLYYRECIRQGGHPRESPRMIYSNVSICSEIINTQNKKKKALRRRKWHVVIDMWDRNPKITYRNQEGKHVGLDGIRMRRRRDYLVIDSLFYILTIYIKTAHRTVRSYRKTDRVDESNK